jgi:hypothetical protein
MAKSIKQLQAELLDEGLLNRLGAQREDLSKLTLTEQLLIRSAANFIERVKQNIEVLGISDTGALSDDISQGELTKQGGTYSISLGYPANSAAAKYYDFVNKGVRGVKSQTPNSPYSFENLGVSRKFQDNILSWIKRNNVQSDVAITKRQSKRQSLSKMASAATNQKSLAYAVAVGIKKKGLRKTGFFDNAVDNIFGVYFATAVSKIAGQDIKILIRQNGNNNQ